MKRIAFFVLFSACLVIQTKAQIRYGFRAGISTTNLDKETVEASGVSLAIKDAKYGYHLGIFARGRLGETFYIQPELAFNANSVDFTVDDAQDGIMDKVLNEKYQHLDIPLMLGAKFGPLRLEAGPTGHVYIASKTELDQIGGYEQRFNDFNLGYQGGIGLDIWKILVDLRYEGNFTRFGDHMRIGGEEVKFSDRPSRWLLTVGFSF
jgi:hypothetical protein